MRWNDEEVLQEGARVSNEEGTEEGTGERWKQPLMTTRPPF